MIPLDIYFAGNNNVSAHIAVTPGAHNLTIPPIPDGSEEATITVTITAAPGWRLVRLDPAPAGWFGTYQRLYDGMSPGVAYEAVFSGELEPITTGGGGEGEKPVYTFTVYAEGTSGEPEFRVRPEEQVVCVGKGAEFIAEKRLNEDSPWVPKVSNWTFDSTAQPPAASSKTLTSDEPGEFTVTAEANGLSDSATLTVVKVEISDPAQDFLCQGDTKTLDATIQPSDRAIQWSVSSNDKVDITETGTLFFKPYGDTWLPDFYITVIAEDSALACCRDSQVIHIKGFKRPGLLVLQGTTIESPAWICASANSVNGSDNCGSDSNTKTLGISYQSNDDQCTGRVTQRQFKYEIEYILITRVDVDILDFGDVLAAAAIYNAKDGGMQIQKSKGCARSDSGVSVSVGPISINVPCPGQDENNESVTLNYTAIDNSEIAPHAPTASVTFSISLTGYGACETKGGWWSTADAGAYLRPHALSSAEGQFSTQEAIFFNPKAPDSP